jgi:hypothetical protein
MAFTQFKFLKDVLKAYQLKLSKKNFIEKTPNCPAPESLHNDINFSLNQGLYKHSEAAICEQLIYPILKTLWINGFLEDMLLWSHTSFTADDTLTGVPDYVFAQRTEYDSESLEPPVLVAIEAKKDNFEEGWGQCAAEMVAAQQANAQTEFIVYGVVTNGKLWEFAKLKANVFSKNKDYIDIIDLDELYSTLYSILEDCKNQLTPIVAPPSV